ncbi:MAG: aconitate hydratase AcnA [Rhodobacteraceae bacterium]|jgi:aconitate hydratase|nr:aconitate hydratase AcnA [Paracoccaceae bacterium]
MISSFVHEDRRYDFHDVRCVLGQKRFDRLPWSTRILAENLLRNRLPETADDRIFGDLFDPAIPADRGALPLVIPRIVLPDSSGLPVLMDLAALRDEVARAGMDPATVEPRIQVDLIVDHSLQVDFAMRGDAAELNVAKEIDRNRERYSFLKWAKQAFANLKLYPPGSGIIHQVHIEQIARVTLVEERPGSAPLAYPDFALGGDSHTPMVNALGVMGWGIGGIEAETVILGQPYMLPKPRTVGVQLTGRLRPGVTGTDLVLSVTRRLRDLNVVGALVEYFGEGATALGVPDRATLANMAPEYGATVGFWPVDDRTLDYLRLTGRSPDHVALIETHCRAAGLFRSEGLPDPTYDQVVEVDLSRIGRQISGPGKPHFTRPPAEVADSFRAAVGGASKVADAAIPPGGVALAAITSCTNTANPAAMITAGLLARNAARLGLLRRPWVKTSFAPGSRAVTAYLEDAGLMAPLEALGFNVIGYGCTTCGGKSGPLLPEVTAAIEAGQTSVASVLSGNRNFDGRIHRLIPANYLASPALVVAYALSGSVLCDLDRDPLGQDADGAPVYLADVWPEEAEIAELIRRFVTPEVFLRARAFDAARGETWAAIEAPTGARFPWSATSDYIVEPPFFSLTARDPLAPQEGLRVLAIFGDGLTTDHISPSGEIPPNSPAGAYLLARGIPREAFNSYVGRRGNHHVMVRGTYANIQLNNLLGQGRRGSATTLFPGGEAVSIHAAAMRYQGEGRAMIVLGGENFGMGSSRDWAAKGQALLGITAVLARSYERIHRSNLIGMGIAPLLFGEGQSHGSLGLDGSEIFTLPPLDQLLDANAERVVTAEHPGGDILRFAIDVDVRSASEADLLRRGGIFIAAKQRLFP